MTEEVKNEINLDEVREESVKEAENLSKEIQGNY
ncbi:MAG: hypothetical protein CM15mV144_420 [Caudoviricetes sp.]|nr:MAG: hypothetical protein CM15mV144_420 [Caudoviricetes sp.]